MIGIQQQIIPLARQKLLRIRKNIPIHYEYQLYKVQKTWCCRPMQQVWRVIRDGPKFVSERGWQWGKILYRGDSHLWIVLLISFTLGCMMVGRLLACPVVEQLWRSAENLRLRLANDTTWRVEPSMSTCWDWSLSGWFSLFSPMVFPPGTLCTLVIGKQINISSHLYSKYSISMFHDLKFKHKL